jgi:hypothetical protein
MGNFGLAEIVLMLIVFLVFIGIPLYLAWYFIRRAKFKEKILLMEKGIDIKDLNLNNSNRITFPWLRIGIIITGTALGALFVSVTNLNNGAQEAVILLFIGVSVILAYFLGRTKDPK